MNLIARGKEQGAGSKEKRADRAWQRAKGMAVIKSEKLKPAATLEPWEPRPLEPYFFPFRIPHFI
jgi:hypothetical protein